jgi:hypothetical protein
MVRFGLGAINRGGARAWLRLSTMGMCCPCVCLVWEASNSLVLVRSANPLRVSDSSVLHFEIASGGTRWLSYKTVVLVTIGGCHILDGLVVVSVEARKKLVRCFREEIMRGTMLTPQEPRRATLVERVIELPSLVGRFLRCPTCGLGGWCQLAAEPLSERSTQRGRSLVTTKWTLGENHRVNFVIPWFAFLLHKLVFTFLYIVLV